MLNHVERTHGSLFTTIRCIRFSCLRLDALRQVSTSWVRQYQLGEAALNWHVIEAHGVRVLQPLTVRLIDFHRISCFSDRRYQKRFQGWLALVLPNMRAVLTSCV